MADDPRLSEGLTLPELETIPKPMVLLETATLLSLAAAILALLLFAWIARDVSQEQTMSFDLFVREKIHQHASPGLTTTMIAISFLGSGGLAITAILAFGIFVSRHWYRAALWLITTILGATALDLTLKHTFHRLRPTPFFVPPPHTYSFPSGHALFSFCFYGVLAGLLVDRVRSRRLRVLIWAVAAVVVMAIGFSRIYLGVHYPSDVIAGYLAATLWTCTMVALDRVRLHRKTNPRTT